MLSFFVGGCSAINRGLGREQKKLTYDKLAAPYNQIILKESVTLDVMPIIQRSEDELGSKLSGTIPLPH